MDLQNPVVKLCIEGSRCEFEGRLAEARACFRQAWEAAEDDFGRCVAAHYSARYQENEQEELRWNLLALEYARKAPAEQVKDFFPSLYLNLGRSYERTGSPENAGKYYKLAAALGAVHQGGANNRWE